jgi:hypothetical protein
VLDAWSFGPNKKRRDPLHSYAQLVSGVHVAFLFAELAAGFEIGNHLAVQAFIVSLHVRVFEFNSIIDSKGVSIRTARFPCSCEFVRAS